MKKLNKQNILTRRSAVILLAGTCCLLWGSAFPFIKIGYRLWDIPSDDRTAQILFAGMRFFLAGILTVIIGSIIAKKALLPKRSSVPKIAALSLFQTILQYIFFYLGLARTSGTKSSVITASNVFLAILVSSFIFRTEKMNLQKLVGSLIGFSGVILINLSGGDSGGGMSLTGEGFIFLSALSYAFSASLTKRFSRTEDTVMLSGWQFIFGGAFMMAVSLLLGGSLPRSSVSGWTVLIYLAFVSAAAFSVWGPLLKHNPVSRISVFGFMNPVFGVILSTILLHENNSGGLVRTLTSLLLVIIGIIIVNRVKDDIAPPINS
ncbi:MAG: EamA family transporter [Ruminococcus sp.]|nr:EamA family transporter [Ruminococcus sp.]